MKEKFQRSVNGTMNDCFLNQLGIVLFMCRAEMNRACVMSVEGQEKNAPNTGVPMKSWTPHSQQCNSH